MSDPASVVTDAITALLEVREENDVDPSEVVVTARLYEDLRLDSLELAELSDVLAAALGRDPYTDGLSPATVGELVAYYDA